jgi:hypothetical protein
VSYNPTLTDEPSMTTAQPLARYGAMGRASLAAALPSSYTITGDGTHSSASLRRPPCLLLGSAPRQTIFIGACRAALSSPRFQIVRISGTQLVPFENALPSRVALPQHPPWNPEATAQAQPPHLNRSWRRTASTIDDTPVADR